MRGRNLCQLSWSSVKGFSTNSGYGLQPDTFCSVITRPRLPQESTRKSRMKPSALYCLARSCARTKPDDAQGARGGCANAQFIGTPNEIASPTPDAGARARMG